MNEELLRERLNDLVQVQPPIRQGASDDVKRGRRNLRMRRAMATTAGVGLLTIGVAVVDGGWLDLGRSTEVDVANAPLSRSAILQQCRDSGARIFDAHWSDGTRVLTFAASGESGRAVLVSSDGERWADCWLRNDGDSNWIATYPMKETPNANSAREHSNGETGPRPGEFSLLERFPKQVAEVALIFDNGSVRNAKALEGFVVFQLMDLDPTTDLESIYLYDDEGTRVAGPGTGPGDGDLPVEYRTLVPQHPIASIGEADPH